MKNIERRKFIGSVVSVFSLLSLEGSGSGNSLTKINEPDKQGRTIRLKGKPDSRIIHYDIITIGNLSRNRYWGESDATGVRSAICTCSIITGKDFHLIIDPSLADETAMTTELNRRTGLTPDKISAVFITHQHGDHIAGLKHFQNAKWFAGAEVASEINRSGRYSNKFEPAGVSLLGAIDVIPTPGHAPGHHSLRFDYRGLPIVVAGDSIATKDFWDEKEAYYNVMDPVESKRSMEMIDSIADIIIPGHDNSFFNL